MQLFTARASHRVRAHPRMMFSLGLVGLVLLSIQSCYALDNGLGLTPPMGWNTWCTDGPCSRDFCNDAEIRAVADALVSSGMADLGYHYVNLDDCWAGNRTNDGTITADSTRFPDFKSTIDYVHSQGLLFGLYTCAGTKTCVGGRPGSYGHYEQDAMTYAKWGIDYVKMDWCNTEGLDPRVQYPQMERALNATGRAIFFNLCEWGVDSPWLWGAQAGNSWRIHHDHHDIWESSDSSGTYNIIEAQVGKSKYAGPGSLNDPDFLMTGGTEAATGLAMGQTWTEYRTEFSFWALWASPLLVATDIRNMTANKSDILLNADIIAINQDPLVKQGDRIHVQLNGGQVWAKELQDGDFAVILFNPGTDSALPVVIEWAQLGWSANDTIAVFDLWTHDTVGHFLKSYEAKVASHGVAFLRVMKDQGKPYASRQHQQRGGESGDGRLPRRPRTLMNMISKK